MGENAIHRRAKGKDIRRLRRIVEISVLLWCQKRDGRLDIEVCRVFRRHKIEDTRRQARSLAIENDLRRRNAFMKRIERMRHGDGIDDA